MKSRPLSTEYKNQLITIFNTLFELKKEGKIIDLTGINKGLRDFYNTLDTWAQKTKTINEERNKVFNELLGAYLTKPSSPSPGTNYTLDLSNSQTITDLPIIHGDQLSHITHLNVSGCTALNNLSTIKLSNLTSFNANGCSALTTLPSGLSASLTKLDVSGCTSLTSLPPVLSASLAKLDVSRCEKLTTLDWSKFPNLQQLDITGSGITELDLSKSTSTTLPSGITQPPTSPTSPPTPPPPLNLTKIQTLKVGPKLNTLSGVLFSDSLTSLDVSGCTDLTAIDCSNLTKLETLNTKESGIKTLDLSNSEVTELPAGIDYSTLDRLIVGAKLKALPDKIFECQSLDLSNVIWENLDKKSQETFITNQPRFLIQPEKQIVPPNGITYTAAQSTRNALFMCGGMFSPRSAEAAGFTPDEFNSIKDKLNSIQSKITEDHSVTILLDSEDPDIFHIGRSKDGTLFIQNSECHYHNYDGKCINFSIKPDGTIFIAGSNGSGFKKLKEATSKELQHNLDGLNGLFKHLGDPWEERIEFTKMKSRAAKSAEKTSKDRFIPATPPHSKGSPLPLDPTLKIEQSLTVPDQAKLAVQELKKRAVTADTVAAVINSLKPNKASILANLNSKKAEVKKFHDEMSRVTSVSSWYDEVACVGLNTFMQRLFIKPDFQELLTNNMLLFLQLSVLDDADFSQFDITSNFNTHTNWDGTIFDFKYNGIQATSPEGLLQGKLFQSFLADILTKSSPIAIFVPPNNAEYEDANGHQQPFKEGFNYHCQLGDTFKTALTALAVTSPNLDDDDTAMYETFDPTQWANYQERFLALQTALKDQFDYVWRDNHSHLLLPFKSKEMIQQSMFSSTMIHFGLDSKHLAHILCDNYDDNSEPVKQYKLELLALLQKLKTDPSKVPHDKQIQLFYRLKLLENRFKEECKGKSNAYQKYRQQHIKQAAETPAAPAKKAAAVKSGNELRDKLNALDLTKIDPKFSSLKESLIVAKGMLFAALVTNDYPKAEMEKALVELSKCKKNKGFYRANMSLIGNFEEVIKTRRQDQLFFILSNNGMKNDKEDVLKHNKKQLTEDQLRTCISNGELDFLLEKDSANLLIKVFKELYDFSEVDFLEAMDQCIGQFALIKLDGKEAQIVDRVSTAFEDIIMDKDKKEKDSALLFFAVLMLNTDLHSSEIKKEKKMTKKQFINNLRGYNFNDKTLEDIYDQVSRNKFELSGAGSELQVFASNDASEFKRRLQVIAKINHFMKVINNSGLLKEVASEKTPDKISEIIARLKKEDFVKRRTGNKAKAFRKGLLKLCGCCLPKERISIKELSKQLVKHQHEIIANISHLTTLSKKAEFSSESLAVELNNIAGIKDILLGVTRTK